MSDEAVSTVEPGVAHYPPGMPVPDKAALLAERLAAGRAKLAAMSTEERQQRRADKKAEREAKAARRAARDAEREAKIAAKAGRGRGPDTVRSARAATTTPAPPPSSVALPPREHLSSSKPKGLLDLISEYPLGTGEYFIQVVRTKPTEAFGVPTAGVQQPLWHPVTDAEFGAIYGGKLYELSVYRTFEGKPARRVTDPVQYHVPVAAPNLDSAVTDEDNMSMPQRPFAQNGHGHGAQRRLQPMPPAVASAEADMHRASLEHQERAEQRRLERQEAMNRSRREAEAETRGGQLEVTKYLTETKEAELDRLERAQARERELNEQRLQEAREQAGGGSQQIIELLKVMRPNTGETKELVTQHASEIRQLSESHKQEMLRLTEQHREEMRAIVEQHRDTLRRTEDQARTDRERADGLVRDAERRAAEQIKEIERRSDASITSLRDEQRRHLDDVTRRGEERLKDLDGQWQRRFDDLKDRKDGELTVLRSGFEGNTKIMLDAAAAEIKRLEREVRAKTEEATKNADWAGRMQEFKDQAEAMGYEPPGSKGDGEDGKDDDLKTITIKTALGLAQNLPQVLESAGKAVASMRGTAAVDPRQQASRAVRGSMTTMPRTLYEPPPITMQPIPFATEDGEYTPMGPHSPPPRQFSSPQAAITQQQMAPPPPPSAPPAPAPPPPPTSVPPPAEQMAPVPPAQQQVAAPGAPEGVTEDQLLSLAQMLSQHGVLQDPASVIQALLRDHGKETIAMVMHLVRPEQLIQVLSSRGVHSEFVTRSGQKYLRDLWIAGERAVAG